LSQCIEQIILSFWQFLSQELVIKLKYTLKSILKQGKLIGCTLSRDKP